MTFKTKDKCKVYIGDRFSRLVILEIISTKYVKVICDCGVVKNVSKYALLSEKSPTKSCGCWQKQAVSDRVRKPFPDAAITQIRKRHSKGSFNRSIEFDLSDDEMMSLVNGPCYYCGTFYSSKITTQTYSYLANGIDRVDNEKHYTKSNCVSCCKFCNRAKSDFGVSFFLNMCKKIVEFQNKQLEESVND